MYSAQSIVLSKWEKRGSEQAAEQRRRKEPSDYASHKMPVCSVACFACLRPRNQMCIQPRLVQYPTPPNDNTLHNVCTNALRGQFSDSTLARSLAGRSRRISVDTADLCCSRGNIRPCLFSEIDPMLCFKFIFVRRGKYVSADPDYAPNTVSSEPRATDDELTCSRPFRTETRQVLSVSVYNEKDGVTFRKKLTGRTALTQLSPCELCVIRGGRSYGARSNRYGCRYPQRSALFRIDTSLHPEAVKEEPVTVDTRNFRAACKRQCLVKLLHTHVLDFPSTRPDWYP